MDTEPEGISLPAIPSKRMCSTHSGVSSPKSYSFEVSPSGYHRRVNKDGMQMLEAILEKRETDKQVIAFNPGANARKPHQETPI